MFKIETIKGHDRMSTQDLLQAISEAVANGETDLTAATRYVALSANGQSANTVALNYTAR